MSYGSPAYYNSNQLYRSLRKKWKGKKEEEGGCWGGVGVSPVCMSPLDPGYSVQFSHLVMSNSLRPHGLQHTRLPCPSSTPGACSNSHPSSRWCHPTISSSVIPFFSCFHSFPASGSFLMSQLFTSDGQIIGVSASSESVLPMNIQDWFLLGLTDLISL